MTKLLEQAYSGKSFRESAHKVVDLLADYLETYQNKPSGETVLPWLEPEEQYKKWQKQLQSHTSVEEIFKEVIDNSIHIHHPKYIGHQVTAPIPLSAIADFAGALLNNGQAIYEMGPVSQAMERIVIEWIAQKFGFPAKAEGIMTSGGTIGNLTALLAARQAKADFNIWKEGNSGKKPAFMVSEQSHYSIDRAVKIMGLGECGIVKIPTDEKLRIKVSKLKETYTKATQKGIQIIGLVANACSTATGTYDLLSEIGDFCASKSLWFHVDSAHGAAAIMSNKYKHFLKGIEKADSVVLDFHKMFMAPALTTAVIFKNPEHSYQTFAQKASYLLNQKREWFNGASRTMECTKIMLSLPVYTVLQAYGEQIFTDYVETTYRQARRFAELVTENTDFELFGKPESNIVCFRFIGDNSLSAEALNTLNAGLREKIVKSGEFYIVQTELNGKLYLRITVMNPFTKVKDFEDLFEGLRKFSC